MARIDVAAAMATVEHLAGTIGPREATGTAYRQAADYLADRFSAAGYVVRRQAVRVPAGLSWGVRVPAGMTWNVIATPTDFDPARPHRVVGAHLDTVPQAPGAEDNASGVAVLLEVARVVAGPDRQIAFVAFGAEEPRGSGDARHHYGSRAYVAAMAVRLRTPARPCTNRSSDHWSFARAGLAAIRLGSTPYPEYHSSRDLPRVVDRAQLTRVGRLLLSWLA